MYKSIFVKYLMTFVCIIVISFSILSWIFTTMIRGYSSDEKDARLRDSAALLSEQIERSGAATMTDFISLPQAPHNSIAGIVSVFPDMNVFLFEADGRAVYGTPEAWSHPDRVSSLDTTLLDRYEMKGQEGDVYIYRSTLDGSRTQRVFVAAVMRGDDCIGYVAAARSTASEDALAGVVKSAIFTSSIWVILAAVIAVYFITERMTRPLREITRAAKTYAKGDFTARVRTYGEDEIAELGHAFNHMAEALEKNEVMRNAFLANVSHDLRTPMTTIAGFIDGINSGAIPPEKHGHYLGIISVEVHRLSRLVSEILDVSRLESGERTFVHADFDVAEMARIILISFEQRIEEKHLDVVFESADSVIAHADKDAIHQVLYNLCHNAIKFAKDGGMLRILIESEEVKDKPIVVRIYDEGQVIGDEELPYVFDRFYKTDKSRGLDKNGVGLGLYISKAIMDAHGETISVRTLSDGERVGCEFMFTLKHGCAAPRKPHAEL